MSVEPPDIQCGRASPPFTSKAYPVEVLPSSAAVCVFAIPASAGTQDVHVAAVDSEGVLLAEVLLSLARAPAPAAVLTPPAPSQEQPGATRSVLGKGLAALPDVEVPNLCGGPQSHSRARHGRAQHNNTQRIT